MFFKLHLLFVIMLIVVLISRSSYGIPIEDISNATNTNNARTSEGFNKSDCSLPPQVGDSLKTCHAYLIRFNFDHVTNTCKTFVYGGCGGNANRFFSEKDCLDACL